MSTTARFAYFMIVAVALVACGSTEAEDAGSDAGFVIDAGSCQLSAAEAVTVRAGGIVSMDVRELTGAAVTLSWPEGFVVRGEQEARAPYAAGVYEVTVSAACGAVETISVTTTELSLAALPSWPRGEGPDAREHPMMWIDPTDAGGLYLFGGLSFAPRQFTVVSDLWRYDFGTNVWTEIGATGAPPLAAGRLAIDEATGDAYYEGGSAQNNASPSSLVKLGAASSTAAWSAVQTNGAAVPGSILHGLIADPARDRLISLAGIRDGRLSAEVWSFELASQTYAAIAADGTKPSARYGFFAGLDRPNDRIVVFSGAQAASPTSQVNPANDTWILDLAVEPPAWSLLLDASASPPGRRNGCAAMDEAGHRFFVWGGTPDARTTETGLWVLDLDIGEERWTRIDTGDAIVRSSCSATYDPEGRRILFGFGNSSTAIYAGLVELRLD